MRAKLVITKGDGFRREVQFGDRVMGSVYPRDGVNGKDWLYEYGNCRIVRPRLKDLRVGIRHFLERWVKA